MHSIRATTKIENIIAKAARANESFAERSIDGYMVKFEREHNGMDYIFNAVVTGADGVIVGKAVCDKYDN